jgi:Ca-activated chloride channel family protein
MEGETMTLDPVLPVWLLAVLGALLLGFAVWRLVVSAGARPRVAWSLRVVAVLLLLVVALRPVIPAEIEQPPSVSGGLEVYIAVDTTSSMAAEDWGDGSPRLDGVKADVEEMAERLTGASFSLITFDAESVQRVPLTSDATALRTSIDAVQQEITAYSRGSSVSEPVDLLAKVLGAAAEKDPQQRRVLFYLGDGEQTAAAEPGSFESLAPLLSGGAVLGYGTDEGGAMRQFNGYDLPTADSPFIDDYSSGSPVAAVSVVDEARLGAIADQLGVPYLHRDASTTVDGLLDGFDVGDVTVREATRGARVEFYWMAAVPLGLLALVELVALSGALFELRAAGRNRQTERSRP